MANDETRPREGEMKSEVTGYGTGVSGRRFEALGKHLEAQDRLGSFELQRLMSAFNQAETLASSVQRKMDDTVSGQQQKIE